MPTGSVTRHELRLDLPAARSSVPAVRHTVDVLLRDLGVSAERERISLAVSEACSNVVLHAYRSAVGPDGEDVVGPLTITVRVAATAIRVAVTDDGMGMEPREDSPGAGFGLTLIRQLADEVTVERADGRTVVEMRFARSGRSAGGGGAPAHAVARAA